MAEPRIFRAAPLLPWQRAHIMAAAQWLREQIARTPDDTKLLAAYEGLLDILDPSPSLVGRQRTMASASRDAAAAPDAERRTLNRRITLDRRRVNLGLPGAERRSGIDRRTGHDRRSA